MPKCDFNKVALQKKRRQSTAPQRYFSFNRILCSYIFPATSCFLMLTPKCLAVTEYNRSLK